MSDIAATTVHALPPVRQVRAYVQLMRPANMITSMADVMAGFAVVGLIGWDSLPWLLASTLCLYAGGIVFNDVFDRRIDAIERLERPIPSGRASVGGAAMLGSVLLVSGFALALRASVPAGAVAVLIGIAALSYDKWAKHVRGVGPFVMGSCRGLNLLLGMMANPSSCVSHWFVPLLPLAYIAGVTLLSTGEVNGGSRQTSCLSAVLMGGSGFGLAAVGVTPDFHAWRVTPFLALLSWRLGPALWSACVTPEPAYIRKGVKAGILSLVVLDSAIAAGYAGWLYGGGLLVLMVSASRLARLFPVT
jgi:hypothetical protein